ncbi:TRAP transporter permease [Alkalihalobacterium alkalinitrilicum]|uniref:TRAP transporter permease n=1 Tax=Alkalihalobacterium alkalinitrilicum TaxID=427920 RepID=UPI00130342CA|nr:TRAP transporter fused permease subunit [Alkalihalobacterium alkalinitrilicum]
MLKTDEKSELEKLKEASEQNSTENERYRDLKGIGYKIIYITGVIFVLFILITILWKPIDPFYMRSVFLISSLVMVLTLVPYSKSERAKKFHWIDLTGILLSIGILSYIFWDFHGILGRVTTFPNGYDVIASIVLLLLLFEATRRLQGWGLVILALIFIIYAIIGNYLPGILWHRGYEIERILGNTFSNIGIFGIPLGVATTYVFMFILLGSFLQVSGVTRVFVDLASSIAGAQRGGPAKVAVLASAFFGTINGTSVGNVVTSGTFTIPMIKRAGYSARFAGATESVASTGGQIMPPIMGAAAFLMAEYLGISYFAVALAATIPALLYFISIFIMVDFESRKKQIKGIPKEKLPNFKYIIIKESYLLIPVFVLLFSLFFLQISPLRAAFYSIIATIIISIFNATNRMGIKKTLDALHITSRGLMDIAVTTAVAGIIIGMVSLTGLGFRFTELVISFSFGIMLLGLILAMLITIVLGMGLPTVAAYAISAVIIAPALIELGVNPLAAHLFILYFASLSAITPPIALASFAAAAIAKAKPMEVALTSVRLGMVAYIIPYMFVYGTGLILQGPFTLTLYKTITCIIGIYALAGFVQGWFIRKVNWYIRCLLLCIGLMLVIPEIISDILGAILLLSIILIQRKPTTISSESTIDSVN